MIQSDSRYSFIPIPALPRSGEGADRRGVARPHNLEIWADRAR